MMKCFMRIEKIKGKNLNSTLQAVSDHNYRVANVPNADPNKADANKVLIDTSGKRDIIGAYYDRMKDAGYYGRGKQPRKDAVKLLDVMLGVTECRPENMENVEEWERANIEWLNKNFGKENVISAVMHMDETGPHIHALVVPLTEDGRLSARDVLGDRTAMREKQASYAANMAPLGLVRGVIGSSARHQDIRKFYSIINEAVSAQLPMPEDGETRDEYAVRIQEKYREISLAHAGEVEMLRQAVADAANIDQSHVFVLGEWEALKAEQKAYDKRIKELERRLKAADRMDEIMFAIRKGLIPEEQAKELYTTMQEVAAIGRTAMEAEKDMPIQGEE